MKLLPYFDAFMRDVVNINDSRLRDLGDRVETLYGLLSKDGDIGATVYAKKPQGSWAHQTIIKPTDGNEFDADFMLVMREQVHWTPRDYINHIYTALHKHGTHAEKTQKKNRCVRVVYANDCHIDIVPFLHLSDGRQVIVNHDTDQWEATNPDAFTAWIKGQDTIAQGNLRRVIRLTKYLRDYRMNFKRTKSVILTVLLGNRVEASKNTFNPSYYADLPTAFVHIFEDLSRWMPLQIPDLPDPSGADNDFNHRWDQSSYDNLRQKVESIANCARAALDSASPDESLRQWQALFGADFKLPTTSGAVPVATVTSTNPKIPTVRSGRDG